MLTILPKLSLACTFSFWMPLLLNYSVVISQKWAKHNLPPEIWREILSYLPVKSLLQFRSVSKIWKSIVEDPEFATFHLRRCTTNNNFVDPSFILQVRGRLIWELCCTKTFRSVPVFNVPVDDISRWESFGERDGLFLLRRRDGKIIMLWNPSIRKSVYIPQPSPWYFYSMFSLGFDPSTNDYKIVRHYRERYVRFFDIFSLKKNSWGEELYHPEGDQYLCRCYNVSGGKYIHWLSRSNDKSAIGYLVSLNLTTEKIVSTPLPVDKQHSLLQYPNPIVVDGSLPGVISSSCIWVLEGLSDDMDNNRCANWSKKYEMDNIMKNHEMLGYLKKDKILLSSEGKPKTFYWYDLTIRKMNLAFPDFPAIYGRVDYVNTHVESLFLVK